MFRYDNSDLSPEALRRFARAPGVQGRAVPPPLGALELALQALRGSDVAVRHPPGPIAPQQSAADALSQELGRP